MLKLRDYQEDCMRAIAEGVKAGVFKPLISLPTGSGKTVVFAHLIRGVEGRSLVLVHRDELLTQAEDKLLTIWPEAQVGIVKAERNELDADVTIASVQTLSRENRLSQARDIRFTFLVTDEAHHAVAASYKRIYDALLRDNGSQLHLGVTATPNRADRRGLGEVYQKVVYHKSLLDMIRAGWLCDLRCVQVKTDISLDQVHTRKGDFAEGELASVINTENRNELIVAAYKEHAAGRLTLCFTVDVEHALDLAEAFRAEGLKALALSGKTPLQERRRALRQFHDREIEVICNCQLLTEGYDEPGIDCIILARPTKSSVLYTQMVGRGTRTFPGKSDCLIVDVADVAGRHRIVQLPELVGLKKKAKLDGKETLTELVDRERTRGPELYHGKGIAAAEVDLFARSRLRWIALEGDTYLINLGSEGKIKVMPSRSYVGKYVIVHVQEHDSEYLSPVPVNLSWALGIAEAEAQSITSGNLNIALKDAPWRNDPATTKQLRILDMYEIDYDEYITKGEASDIIDVLFATAQAMR
jgi:superfamily II DNA or RNA helicase